MSFQSEPTHQQNIETQLDCQQHIPSLKAQLFEFNQTYDRMNVPMMSVHQKYLQLQQRKIHIKNFQNLQHLLNTLTAAYTNLLQQNNQQPINNLYLLQAQIIHSKIVYMIRNKMLLYQNQQTYGEINRNLQNIMQGIKSYAFEKFRKQEYTEQRMYNQGLRSRNIKNKQVYSNKIKRRGFQSNSHQFRV